MVEEKRIDDGAYGKIVKELTALAQLIRIGQKEKQAAIDSFDREVKMYRNGKISKKALRSSVPKTRKVIQKLDKNLKSNIDKAVKTHRRAITFIEKQAPKRFKVTMQGVRSAAVKKKVTRKKKKR